MAKIHTHKATIFPTLNTKQPSHSQCCRNGLISTSVHAYGHLFVCVQVCLKDRTVWTTAGHVNSTFYGMEVCTREISHDPLLLMGGAHVNLWGSGDKHDMMSLLPCSNKQHQSPPNKYCVCKARQVITPAISAYKAR